MSDAKRSLPQTCSVAALAGIGYFAIALEAFLTLEKARSSGISVLSAEARTFSFFTVLTNLLVAAVLTAVVARPKNRLGRFLERPAIQAAFVVYIIVVGAVYNLMLRKLWHPEGWQKVADEIFHDLIPVAYTVYWLLWAPKGHTAWIDAIRWLGYPLAYGVYSLIRGAIIGAYPYPFLNVNRLGYPQVLFNMLMLTVAMIGLGSVVIAIDHWLGRCSARKSLKDLAS